MEFLVDSRDAELHVRTEMLESKAELEVSCAKLSTSIPACSFLSSTNRRSSGDEESRNSCCQSSFHCMLPGRGRVL